MVIGNMVINIEDFTFYEVSHTTCPVRRGRIQNNRKPRSIGNNISRLSDLINTLQKGKLIVNIVVNDHNCLSSFLCKPIAESQQAPDRVSIRADMCRQQYMIVLLQNTAHLLG